MLPWKSALLVLAVAVTECRAPAMVEQRSYANGCARADAIVLSYSGSLDKPIYPVFIGLAGRQYPPDLVNGPYPTGHLSPHLVDSTFYVALATNMRRSVPPELHRAEESTAFGTISLCLGRELVNLGSQRDAAAFFRVLLPTIMPTNPAETRLKADLENFRNRIGG